MPADPYHSPIPPQLWDAIRFGLPAVAQGRERLEARFPDPAPVLRQLFRVIGDGTFCPGFLDGTLPDRVLKSGTVR